MKEKKPERNELAKYAENLSTIKALLMDVDETPMTETWVFFAWGALCLAGTAVHAALWLAMDMSLYAIFIRLWLPIIAIGSILDFSAHIMYFTRQALPFFSRPMVKNWILALGVGASISIIIYYIIQSGTTHLVPAVLLASMATFFFIMGHMMGMQVFIYAFILFATSIMLHVTDLPMQIQTMVSAGMIGICTIATGITQMRMDRNRHGQ